jgi:hypothetical protein
MPYEQLSKSRIISALRRLGELAQEKGVILEASLYGGAVFTVVYGSRNTTKDVDAIVHPSALARTLSAQVAGEQGLPDDWLNDDVRFFLADKEAKRRLKGDEFGPGLQVSVPTAAYLLAMKLRACRAPQLGHKGDYEDIQFLVRKMEMGSPDEAEKVYDRFFPNDVLPEAALELVKRTIAEHGKP